MENITNNISETIKMIEKTSEMFYQQKEQEGYLILGETLKCLEIAVDGILSYKVENTEDTVNKDQLNSILKKTMDAIEKKDIIMISDILEYELKEILNGFLAKL